MVKTAMQKLFFAIIFFIGSSVGNAADLTNQFVTEKLSYGVTVSIPKSWHVLRGNEMRAVETSTGAAIDQAGHAKKLGGVETLITANFSDPDLYAGVTITTLSTPGVTSTLMSSLTDAQLKSGEATIRQGIETTLGKLGTKVFGWSPLRKIAVGRNFAMYTSYMRSSDIGERKVHLYKFFGADRIYDMALSTSVKQELLNTVVLEKIANSFFIQ